MKAAITKWILAALLVVGLTTRLKAQELTCDVCGVPLGDKIFMGEDRMTGEPHKICPNCAKIEERCFICGLPVKEGYKKLADERILCARDAKEAIESESDAKEICVDVRDGLDRLLSRFITFPANSVAFAIVDKPHMGINLPESDYTNTCASVFGTTASRVFSDEKFAHSINILSHLQKSSLMAVCAHECTHTWLNENLRGKRRQTIDRDTVEGFCELVAYKYMESLGFETEMRIIRRNAYTKGQAAALIEADKRFGFNMVVEWMKSGDDVRLDVANLERIRAVGGDASRQAKAVEWVVPAQGPPPPAPDTLMLKGISGAVGHRFALINNATFEPMQRAKVRVGQTNVSVVCLEIREKSVTIQVNGEKQELFLRVK